MSPSHMPPPRDPDPKPGQLRRVLASLDPHSTTATSPLRRMLRRAGITGPFDPSTTTAPPTTSPDQENPHP